LVIHGDFLLSGFYNDVYRLIILTQLGTNRQFLSFIAL